MDGLLKQFILLVLLADGIIFACGQTACPPLPLDPYGRWLALTNTSDYEHGSVYALNCMGNYFPAVNGTNYEDVPYYYVACLTAGQWTDGQRTDPPVRCITDKFPPPDPCGWTPQTPDHAYYLFSNPRNWKHVNKTADRTYICDPYHKIVGATILYHLSVPWKEWQDIKVTIFNHKHGGAMAFSDYDSASGYYDRSRAFTLECRYDTQEWNPNSWKPTDGAKCVRVECPPLDLHPNNGEWSVIQTPPHNTSLFDAGFKYSLKCNEGYKNYWNWSIAEIEVECKRDGQWTYWGPIYPSDQVCVPSIPK